ncbi:nitroreductase family protein [Paenibacillus antri]|uniref:Nitroreductase family protein n=1 Tax=Paenibacillus antri TaxID=2582848 RepID=A0A5R9G115_9BACL|nr:nitroreductase family protein [Paenibacillus antri]TLS49481.1 nitroreductase family protein [Paenibacillus antri]
MEPTVIEKAPRTPETIRVMEERHSVRAYEPGIAMPREDLDAILRAAGTAPSSWNLQPWKFLAIEDAALREKLLPIANHQRQVVESSAVVAVLGDLEGHRNAELVYGERVKSGAMSAEIKDTLVGQVERAYGSGTFARDEAFLNGGFAAMQLMLAAKALGYETCPMGGFRKDAFIEAFRVPERYVPLLLISIGKPAKAAHPSTRFPLEETVVRDTF